jgi:hypothetical protein
MRRRKHWRSMTDHQALAVELVRIAFEELADGLPDNPEGQRYRAAEMTGKYMATIAHWERAADFPNVIDGEQTTQKKGRITDGN